MNIIHDGIKQVPFTTFTTKALLCAKLHIALYPSDHAQHMLHQV
jgi:hypothetical protein